MMQSWRQANPNWEIRFYDDEACLEFVQHEFPEYLDAYRQDRLLWQFVVDTSNASVPFLIVPK